MQCHPQVLRSSTHAVVRQFRDVARGKDSTWVLLEGLRLVRDALQAGIRLSTVLVREDRQEELGGLPEAKVPCFAVAPVLYERLGSVQSPPPLMALAEPPFIRSWADVSSVGSPLVLVAAGIADPGNLGALARSAEAAGAKQLVRVGGGVHPFQPKALRGSMGSLLRLPVVLEASAQRAYEELQQRGFRQACAATRGGKTPLTMDWSGPLALWVSGETGEQPAVMDALEGITIPMCAPVESLNVTVAAALLLFAAGRVLG